MRHISRYVAIAIFAVASFAIAAKAATAGEVAYVPLGSDKKLVLVDVSTDKVVGTIKGIPDAHGLAGTPDGRYVIVGDFEGRRRNGKAPPKPSGMSANEHAAHHRQSAPHPGARSSEISTLAVVSTAEQSVVRRIDVPGAVHHLAVSPDGRYAVVAHPNEGTISAVDLKTYQVVANVATGPSPDYVAFSPDGSLVYVSNAGNGTVSAVDVERWIVRWNAIVRADPGHMVLSKDGTQLFVSNSSDGSVSVIDVADQKTVKTIKISSGTHGLDLSDDDKTLFVAAIGNHELVAIDLATGRSRRVQIPATPDHVTVVPGRGKVYVIASDKPKIWVVEQKSLKIAGEIPVGGYGHQIAFAPRG